MKILFFVGGLGAGGAERVACTLASAWAARGDAVCLVPTWRQMAAPAYALPAQVRLHWLVQAVPPGLRRGFNGPLKWWCLRRLVRRERPDVIISFLVNVNVNVLIATRGLRVPVLVCERSHPGQAGNVGRWLARLRRWLYPQAQAVVVQTAAAAQALARTVPHVTRLAVLPNPLPPALPVGLALRLPSARPSRVLAAMGRLAPVKRFDHLIRAFAALAAEFPDWQLCIWGEGAERAPLQRQIAAAGLSDRVRLAGHSTQPWEDLAQAQAFALTSRVEGFPNALLEAMALGLPALAVDCPSGPAELSGEGRDAVLVPAEDAAALVAGLRRLLADADLRERLGRQATASVQARYALPVILAEWDGLMRAVGAMRAAP